MACEFDPECRQVYSAAFPDLPPERFISNIRELTRVSVDDENSPRSERDIDALVPDHDVLCGGFPCQPFSKSGAQRGVRDTTRGTLFFDIMEIARAKRPRYMILENVRNIAGPRHTATWRTVIDSIRDAGYSVAEEPLVLSPHLIPRALGGAPQVRDRVFLLCELIARTRKRHGPPLLRRDEFAGVWNPDDWRITDYLDADDSIAHIERYRLGPKELAWLEAWDQFVRCVDSDALPGFPIWVDAFRVKAAVPSGTPDWERAFLLKNSEFYRANKRVLDGWLKQRWGSDGVCVGEFPASRRKFEWQARKQHPTRTGRTIRDLVCQMRPSGIRVKPATYLPALVAITQTSILGPGLGGVREFRTLTPAEAARLQGVPSEAFARAGVSDRAAFKQLGNAVNVGVAMLAMRALRGSIQEVVEARAPLFAGVGAPK